MSLQRLLRMMIVLAASTPTMAQSWDLQIGTEMLLPTGDFWSAQAWGVETQGIRWFDQTDNTEIGLGLSIGVSQWEADDQFSQYIIEGNSGSRQWRGDMLQIPLGISYLNRVTLNDHTKAILELGMRYVLCNDDFVMIRTSDDGFGGTLSQDFEVDCDNGVVGRIAGVLHVKCSERLHGAELMIKGGYQFDLAQGEISGESFTQTESQDLELTAFYLGLGIFLPF